MSLITKNAQGIFDPRLQIAGYWGVPSSLGQSVNYTGRKAFDLAKKTPGFLAGVSVWGADTSGGGDGPSQDVLASGFTLPPPTSPLWAFWNGKGSWTAIQVSNAADWEAIPNPFGSGAALLYSHSYPNLRATFQSPPSAIRANGSFLFRLGLAEIDNKTQKYQNVGLVFGGAPYRFRLEWNKGAGSSHTIWLHRLLPAWNLTEQRALDAMSVAIREAKENNSSSVATMEEAFWAKWHTLYAQSDQINDLSLEATNSIQYGQYFFVPEPSLNRVRIFGSTSQGSGNGKGYSAHEVVINVVPHPLETEARRSAPNNQLWGSTSLTLDTNGGVMMWQLGVPDWNRKSVISLPSSLGGGGAIGGHWDETQPGTDVSFVLSPLSPEEGEEESDEVFKPRIELISDGRYPALLYDAYGWRDGGARNGDTAFVWDTDEHRVMGLSQIFDIGVSCDGPFNRCVLRVSMSMHEQDLIGSGTYQRLFHDHMAKVSVNGQTILGNGIILRATGNDWKFANREYPPIQATDQNSKIEWEIADLWQLADEWLIREDPILDGLDLGAALRRLLRLFGSLTSEMAGVPTNTGIILDRAEVGEAACERPAYETSAGDAMRALMTKYAPDWILSPRSGVWTLSAPSEVFVARFTREPQPGQATPEFAIFEPLDIIRDFTNFHNDFRLSGAPASLDSRDVANAPTGAATGDPNALQGETVVVDWFNRNSAAYPASIDYIGRIKRAKTVNDAGKSTRGQAMRAVRGIAKEGGELGRWYRFVSDTILNLYPGAKVYVENTPCKLDSVGDGSIQYGEGKMVLLARELR